jgi:DNA-binding response OmpR family regulator
VNILIVEDEKLFATALKKILEKHGFSVTVVNDGELGLAYASSGAFSAIIMDIMLPRRDGFSVVKELRANKIDTPIIMLTARVKIDDKITAFSVGADDYLTKPFQPQELILRLEALMRRGKVFREDFIEFGDIKLDKTNFTILCGEKSVQLTKKEFELFLLLVENVGHAVSREKISARVWGFDTEVDYNNSEVYISFLRKKVSMVGSAVKIRVLRGVGYLLEEK